MKCVKNTSVFTGGLFPCKEEILLKLALAKGSITEKAQREPEADTLQEAVGPGPSVVCLAPGLQ